MNYIRESIIVNYKYDNAFKSSIFKKNFYITILYYTLKNKYFNMKRINFYSIYICIGNYKTEHNL